MFVRKQMRGHIMAKALLKTKYYKIIDKRKRVYEVNDF